MVETITFHIFAADFTPEKSWDLVDWCHRHGADEFTLSIVGTVPEINELGDAFDLATGPFLLPEGQRRMLSKQRGEGWIRRVPLWRLNQDSIDALRRLLRHGVFSGYYESSGSAWYEDLMLYRAAELMLGVVSHEREGIVRVVQNEKDELDAQGFVLRPKGEWVGYSDAGA
jgi:hypothetical protein